jgi:hypothetical protein
MLLSAEELNRLSAMGVSQEDTADKINKGKNHE